MQLRRTTLLIAVWSAAALGSALAQPSEGRAPGAQPPAGQDCAPTDRDAPTVGSGDRRELGDKLADSKGVICPPPSGDRDMQVTPPAGGALKVIPPPGSPGGDQSVQPK